MSAVQVPKLYQLTIAAGGTRQKLFGAAVPRARFIEISAPAANTSSFFYGDSTVSSTNGIEIAKGTSRIISAPDLLATEAIYAISATTSDKLNILVWEQK